LRANIIGRESGRSAIGASAYRAGEKLRAVEKASYRSGEKLQDKDAKMVHDYTYRSGVVYTEILVPDNAPEKYLDRETLWNSVERKEKRKDARLAREIVVALPREFDFEEQVEVMQEYIMENFVSEDMIADLAIHDKSHQCWLWWAIDHSTKVVLAYCFGTREHKYLDDLLVLLSLFKIKYVYCDDNLAYQSHVKGSVVLLGKRNTQRILRKHLSLRTWCSRLVRKGIASQSQKSCITLLLV
jgi:IS1 family transposase